MLLHCNLLAFHPIGGAEDLNLFLQSGSYYNWLLRDNTTAAAILLNRPEFNRTALGSGFRYTQSCLDHVCIVHSPHHALACRASVLSGHVDATTYALKDSISGSATAVQNAVSH